MSTRPKNLLFLLADQFRHDAAGFLGGPAPTPHLDALASDGVVFANAYTPLPVCGPARRALLSGRHPDAMGAYWNQGFFPTPAFVPGDTLGERLRDTGRRGGFVGKWDASAEHGPRDFGFDVFCDKADHAALVRERYPDATHGGGWMGCESPLPVEDADTHFLAQRAIDFLGNTPDDLFLWVDFGAPHLPCQPSAPFSRMVRPEDVPPWPGYDDPFENKPYCHRQQAINWGLEDALWSDMAPQVARYYGVVAQLDDAIGRILSALRASGRWDDTLIVFTSDHGDMCGNHRMLDKHYVLYDDVVRVPLVLSGGAVADLRGTVCEDIVCNCLDLPVTLCELFGARGLPGAHGRLLPGFGGAPRAYATSSTNGQQFGFYCARMITDGHRKYVWNLTDVDELYDLDADPAELHNLAGHPAHAEELARLRLALYEELKRHGDPFASPWLAPQLLEGRKWMREG